MSEVSAGWVDLKCMKAITDSPALGKGTAAVIGFTPHQMSIEAGELVEPEDDKQESHMATMFILLAPDELKRLMYEIGDLLDEEKITGIEIFDDE